MATYLLAQDVLNVEVSCFANYNTPSNPRPVNLYAWLINTKYRDKVLGIRAESEKLKRDTLKATLPAITPSGEFTYRQASDLIRHSKLLQFDIDFKDNPQIRNYANLKDQLAKLPFVAYCGLSVSGTGYWGLVPIAYSERHRQHFDALRRVFAHYGINLDDKPRNVASLRGYSYDIAAYFAQQVMLFELYDEPQPVAVRQFSHTVNANTEQQRVEVCLGAITRCNIDITSGYNNWYAIGCDLASTFGEGGRSYFHVVSQCHPEYQPAACDKQYTHCLRSYKEVQLKAFFGRCRDNGISWKGLLPYEPPERTNPLGNKSETRTRPTGKTGKSIEEHKESIANSIVVEVAASEVVSTLEEWRSGLVLKPTEDQLEREPEIEEVRTYPSDWDESTICGPIGEPPKKQWFEERTPTNRIAHPTAPLAFDAVEQLQRILWCVIPPGVEEANYNPVLIPSPNRQEYATSLGISPDQLPLYQLATKPC